MTTAGALSIGGAGVALWLVVGTVIGWVGVCVLDVGDGGG